MGTYKFDKNDDQEKHPTGFSGFMQTAGELHVQLIFYLRQKEASNNWILPVYNIPTKLNQILVNTTL